MLAMEWGEFVALALGYLTERTDERRKRAHDKTHAFQRLVQAAASHDGLQDLMLTGGRREPPEPARGPARPQPVPPVPRSVGSSGPGAPADAKRPRRVGLRIQLAWEFMGEVLASFEK